MSKLLSCPLCLHPHFDNVNALRTALIAIATMDINCPMCSETLKGLDKFTIHLFSHIVVVADTNATVIDTVVAAAMPAVDAVEIEEEITNVQIELANETHTIRCDICSFTFSDENILDMHQKLLHQTLEDKRTGMYSYHCHLCSKKFKMKGSLMVHLRVAHYGFSSTKSEEIEQSERSNQHDKGMDETTKKWSCAVCNKLFTTKYFLKKHNRLHTGEMPYFCAMCNKHFTFQQSYRKHLMYHSSEKPHVCAVCGRAFKELSTLHNHERIHSGERPFACETCGKCFRQRVSYLVHKRIHTGAMPYKCAVCGKTFRYKVSQRSHKCQQHANPSSPSLAANDVHCESITTIAQQSITNDNPKVDIIFPNDNQHSMIGHEYVFDGQKLISIAERTTTMKAGPETNLFDISFHSANPENPLVDQIDEINNATSNLRIINNVL